MMVALATSAAAHDTIIDAEPAHDAVLDTAPTEIVLTYSAEVLDLPAAIIVTDANGEIVVEGEPRVQGHSVVLDLPSLANGTYEVLWSVVSSDGHRTEDVYNFTVDASETAGDPLATTPDESTSETPTAETGAEPATPAPATSPDRAADADSPVTGWPIGAVILVPVAVLALALIAALLYRRRRQP